MGIQWSHQHHLTLPSQMGYPVIQVKETKDGITVRQDRFLETGPAPPEENETIWCVILSS